MPRVCRGVCRSLQRRGHLSFNRNLSAGVIANSVSGGPVVASAKTPFFNPEDIAALFIAIEAQAGMAVLTEGIFPMLPSTLTARRFSPELAPLLIAAGTPAHRPNPHSESFLKILLEEINKSSRRKR